MTNNNKFFKKEYIENHYNFRVRILAELLAGNEIEFEFFKKKLDALKKRYEEEKAKLEEEMEVCD